MDVSKLVPVNVSSVLIGFRNLFATNVLKPSLERLVQMFSYVNFFSIFYLQERNTFFIWVYIEYFRQGIQKCKRKLEKDFLFSRLFFFFFLSCDKTAKYISQFQVLGFFFAFFWKLSFLLRVPSALNRKALNRGFAWCQLKAFGNAH